MVNSMLHRGVGLEQENLSTSRRQSGGHEEALSFSALLFPPKGRTGLEGRKEVSEDFTETVEESSDSQVAP